MRMIRQRRTALVWALVVVSSFVNYNLPHCSVSAFQPDLLVQAFQTAASTFSSSSPPTLDAIAFAAVNLLDSQHRPLFIFPTTTADSQKKQQQQQTVQEEQQQFFPTSAYSYPYEEEKVKVTPGDFYNYYYDDEVKPLCFSVTLSDEEVQLFRLIKQVRDKYCPNTTLRIGGGWVRDKLVGRENSSPDIDFVLDNMSGSEFARLVHEKIMTEGGGGGGRNLASAEFTTPCSLKEYEDTSSKHLQSASLQVGSLEVDFAQLRFEKYNPDSRVPAKTGIASVVEDAFRRDLTINALFYNLNTNQVEDWTEQGLQDLQYQKIRTPMAPLSTLVQDPLRILRAIRFSAQLSFTMDSGLKKAALDNRVRRSLQQKVSKERVGKEIDAIFRTRDPRRGIGLLIETKLADIVFPLRGEGFPKVNQPPYSIYNAGFFLLYRVQTLVSRIFTPTTEWDETKRRYLWYAAFFKPFSDSVPSLFGIPSKTRNQRRDNSILHHALVRDLRRPTSDILSVESIVDGARTLQRFLRLYEDSVLVRSLFFESGDQEKNVAEFRWLCYRILKKIGPLWKESLILALASSPQYKLAQAVELYGDLVRGLQEQVGLNGDTLRALKPLLNGSQVQKRALPGVTGKGFRQIMEAQEKWQVHHGVTGTTESNSSSNKKEEQEAALIEYLVKTFPQYSQAH